MKNASILLLVSVFLIFFSSGCTVNEGFGELQEMLCTDMDPGEDKDHCYQGAAVNKGDPELCEKIDGEGPASKCYALVAAKTGNIKLCENLPTGTWAYRREDCIIKAAVDNQKPEYCYEIDPDYSKERSDITPEGAYYITQDACLNLAEGECGKPGIKCCLSKERSPCDSGLECRKGKCQYEDEDNSAPGDPCSGECDFPMYCTSKGICADKCGGTGQACCWGRICNEAGVECQGDDICKTEPCGKEGDKACPGNVCRMGLDVVNGYCLNCGSIGKRCCPDPHTPCVSGTCINDECVA